MRCAAICVSIVMLSLASGLRGLAESASAQDTGPGTAAGGPDFNGDGFDDLAVGVPLEDVARAADAGAVHVLYGSPSGLQADAPDDQLWTQDSANAGDTAEGGDQFGFSLAAGDLNGDGFSDLAAGAPFEDVGPAADAGAVTVLYGSAAGLQASSPPGQTWSQDSPGVRDAAEGGDQFGFSLAAGDLNGDGFSDLAAGAHLEDVGSIADAGAVTVLYGSAAGLQAVSPPDQGWTQNGPSVQDSAEAGDEFGYALAAGDYDADGFDDLAIGVRFEDIVRQDTGLVQILYGSSAGAQAVAPNDQRWSQGRDGLRDTAESNDRFGSSLTGGDFNGDGFHDLVVGVPYEDVGSQPRVSNAGAVNVVYGSAAGLQASSPDDQYWDQDSTGVIGLAESPDQFGYSVAAGDYDADGFDDLAAGVRNEDGGPETIPRSGAVNILYGSATGIQTARDWHLDQDGPGVEDSAEEDDRLGTSVVIHDFNGDGYADLATGAGLEEEGASQDCGAVHVLYGSGAGLQSEFPDDVLWSQDDAGMQDPAEPGDQFGHALA